MSTDRIATAAHVHVLLRRKTGRVTDTEWMASNAEYAAEIVRFCREKAVSEGHADLAEWADRLERVMAIPNKVPPVPLAQKAATALREHLQQAHSAPARGGWPLGDPLSSGPAGPGTPAGSTAGLDGPEKPNDTRYIGRLR